jgi:hypothetical protein
MELLLSLLNACDANTWQRRNIFIRDKPVFSSERMLRKDYGRNSSDAKEKKLCGRESLGTWRQDELIGGKPSVVK